MRHSDNDLPLGNLINGIDVINTFLLVHIALIHTINAQVTGLAIWSWFAVLSYGYLNRIGFGINSPATAIDTALSQVIQV